MGVRQLHLVRENATEEVPVQINASLNVVYTKYHQSCNKRSLNCRMGHNAAHLVAEAKSKET